MSGEIYKYRKGCTHVGEFYKWNDGYVNVSGDL